MNKHNISASKSELKLKYHIYFWLGFFTFNVLRWGSYYNDFYYSVKSNIIEFPIHITLSYFHAYLLLPKYIVKKKYLSYVLLMFLSLSAMYFVKTALTFNILNENVWPEAIQGIRYKQFLHYITVVLGELYIIGITTAIKLTSDWINSRNRNQELLRLNLETELKYLRAQIQPHFFFNTLNNLYALTVEKSDKAPNVVIKLSGLMQYVLYEARVEQISLIKEINYIESYLNLEKLKYGSRLKQKTEIIGDISQVMVPPLIFIPFIENCFKHGVSPNNDDINIRILFDASGEFLIFEVINPIPEIKDKRYRQLDEGIGISNAKKRLELNYSDNYKLDISKRDSEFLVRLEIPKELNYAV